MLSKLIMVMLAAAIAPVAFSASPEPTEEEIRALTEQDIGRANQPIIEYHRSLDKGEVPSDMLVRLNGLRKLDCKPVADVDAHDCNIEMDVSVPQGGRRMKNVQVRFTRTDGVWKGGRSQ